MLFACLAWILYGRADVLPPYVLGLVAGFASGAAMLPYTVIKEANPPEMSGTATGVVNFLNFTFSALLGPVFGWILMARQRRRRTMTLEHYQTTFEPLLYGVGARDRSHALPEGDGTGGSPRVPRSRETRRS